MKIIQSIVRGKQVLNILILMDLIALISLFLFKEKYEIISVIVTLILGVSTIIQSERMANDTKRELDMAINDRTPCLVFDDVHGTNYINTKEIKYTKPNFNFDFIPGYEDKDDDIRIYLAFYKNKDNSTKVNMEFKVKNITNTILSEVNIYYVSNYGNKNECWIQNCYKGGLERLIEWYDEDNDEKYKEFVIEAKENGVERLYKYEKSLSNIEPNKSYLCHFAFEESKIIYDNWRDHSKIYELAIGFEMISIYGVKYKQVVKVLLEQVRGQEFIKHKFGQPENQYIYRIIGTSSSNFFVDQNIC